MPGFSLTIVMSSGGTEAGLETLQWKEIVGWMPPGVANKFSMFQSEKNVREFKSRAEKGKSIRSILSKNIIVLFQPKYYCGLTVVVLLFSHRILSM